MINLVREIEFTSIEKCKIEAKEGEIIIKKGVYIPQAYEKEAEMYLKNFLRRKILRMSNSL